MHVSLSYYISHIFYISIPLFAGSLCLLLSGCGKNHNSHHHSKLHLVGGDTVPLQQKNAVSVILRENRQAICEGSYIHTGVILTAAHCLIGPVNADEIMFASLNAINKTDYTSIDIKDHVVLEKADMALAFFDEMDLQKDLRKQFLKPPSTTRLLDKPLTAPTSLTLQGFAGTNPAHATKYHLRQGRVMFYPFDKWKDFITHSFVKNAAPYLERLITSERKFLRFLSTYLANISSHHHQHTGFIMPVNAEEFLQTRTQPSLWVCTGDSGAPLYQKYFDSAYVAAVLTAATSTKYNLLLPHPQPNQATSCNPIGIARPVYPYLNWINQKIRAFHRGSSS